MYIVLFWIFFTINVGGIGAYFVYFHGYLEKMFTRETTNFRSNLLKIDKKPYKNNDIYYIGYITIKKIDDYESIYRVNPLYLVIDHGNGYIEEENGNKYLIFDSVDENKEVLKKICRCLGRNLKKRKSNK